MWPVPVPGDRTACALFWPCDKRQTRRERTCHSLHTDAGPTLFSSRVHTEPYHNNIPSSIMAGLAKLESELADALKKLAYPDRPWTRGIGGPNGEHVYEVVIIGGGQCGLTAAFGLMREHVENILVSKMQHNKLWSPWSFESVH